jgi:type IV pilus assembly protein PilW
MSHAPRLSAAPWRKQRGLSLVELMVGITVGLFVVAAAATLVANQLSDNRRLLLETQMQQDLRATMDIMTRQLRRAGALTTPLAQAGLASPAGVGGAPNAYAAVTPTAAADSLASFRFILNAAEQGPYGFKLEGNAIKTLLAGGGWQELTDSSTLKITALTFLPRNQTLPNTGVPTDPAPGAFLPCSKPCADGTTNCWPRLLVRNFRLTITAQAKSDPTVQRSISSEIRLRNDWLDFTDAANPALVCPL